MSEAWRLAVQSAAGSEDDPARPRWTSSWARSPGIPFCVESCAHHDGLCCRLIHFTAPKICEPVVVQMAKLLSAGPR